MSGYCGAAGIYDAVNSDIDYSAWADFIVDGLSRFGAGRAEPELVLDLACGTGSLTCELAARGFDMTGVDSSPEMLEIARERCGGNVLLLCQDMSSFELYGTVGAVVCCLDSVNHLTEDGDLDECFSCVHNYLVPGGVFIFDINTRKRFEDDYGELAYLFPEVTEDGRETFCAWQNDFDPDTGICDFGVTVFEETEAGSGLYSRTDDEWSERYYPMEEIRSALERCGMKIVAVAGAEEGEVLPRGLDWDSPVGTGCGKIHIAAVAVK